MSPVPGNNRQDPHNPDEEDLGFAAMDANIFIAAGSSSESAGEDEEDLAHQGYQMLPQDPQETADMDVGIDSMGATGGASDNLDETIRNTVDREDLGRTHIPSYMQNEDTGDSETNERLSLWSDSNLHPGEPMNEDHLNQIKSIMTGIHLPGCNVPDWARVVSEEEWKTQLLSRLHGQKSQLQNSTSSTAPTSSNSQLTAQRSTDSDNSEVDPPNKRVKCSLDEDSGDDNIESTPTDNSSKVLDNNTEQKPGER